MPIPEIQTVTQDEVKDVADGISVILQENAELQLANDRLRTQMLHFKSEVISVRCDNHTLNKQIENMQYLIGQKDFQIEKMEYIGKYLMRLKTGIGRFDGA
jgi:regulator of replication initiation timing